VFGTSGQYNTTVMQHILGYLYIIQNQIYYIGCSGLSQIGPIPVDDDVGKEVITQLTANMSTNSTFYTDSNGRDFLKRVMIYNVQTLDICYYYFFKNHTISIMLTRSFPAFRQMWEPI
jgi:hypothetical protein